MLGGKTTMTEVANGMIKDLCRALESRVDDPCMVVLRTWEQEFQTINPTSQSPTSQPTQAIRDAANPPLPNNPTPSEDIIA